jgi:sugar transferase EpsL
MPLVSHGSALAVVLKRGLDLLVSGVALVPAASVMAAAALAIRATMGAPVLFRQPRPGLRERPFTLLKFRTMSEAADAAGRPLPDGERLTPVGRLLRRLSIDELPQLLNVLRGEMSLVGPRPLLTRYLERYSPAQRRRHEVKPGITGWAQVNGRNAITWDDKFRHDLWYVDHWTPALDARILWRTAVQVLRREGITAAEHATMPEFMGTTDLSRPPRSS